MKVKSKQEGHTKSIRTKLLVLPVSLIILSIIGILAVVWLKTNNNMMAEMEAQSDYLLHNVSARLTDYDSDDQESYQNILEEFESQQNVEYAGFINSDYVSTANSDQVLTSSRKPQFLLISFPQKLLDKIRHLS